MTMKAAIQALVAAALFALAGALPAGATKHESMTEAEVRKVDREAGKVTLKHGAIPNLEMTPMTMVFRVKDAAMLEALKAGDRIRFRAERVQGAYTVVEVVPAK
jgi:Cu(I)/Ag(I) efflux system periplasmic protein CusF